MHVIGTAGHIDHGKSTLVEALTGIDPDRLKEEKERGMTVDLGFAWFRLPSGSDASIVDVPGHERFVNNMLAGVGGIDLALLVVAADESVMPQTREHLAILDLLKIQKGIVAVTKSDLVDPDWLGMVTSDVEEVLIGTSLENSSIIHVSALTGEGLSDLVAQLDVLLADIPPKKNLGRPRLPIDRAFTMQGFGTVVTGTLIDGSLAVDQEVELIPHLGKSRIRGLQTHRAKIEEAVPGSRVAANLAGVAHEKINRGEVLASIGWLKPSAAVDVHLKVIDGLSRRLRHNMFVTLHTGSSEVIARLRLLESSVAEPGETTWAQLKLNEPIAAVKGDYFVIRSSSTTLGGGSIVDLRARRHKRRYSPLLDKLAAMEEGSEREVLLKTIENAEPAEFESVVNRANLESSAAASKLESMALDGDVVMLGKEKAGPRAIFYTAVGWSKISKQATDWLHGRHETFPLRKGVPKEELRSRLNMPTQLFNGALARLVNEKLLIEQESMVKLPDYRPTLSPQQIKDVDAYINILSTEPYAPPTDVSIDQEVLSLLVDQGQVVKVNEDVVFTAQAYNQMLEKILEYIQENGEVTVADVRDLFGTSRKYSLAIMDYLDHQRITRRTGDVRVLR